MRLYDHLFRVPVPGGDEEDGDWKVHLNPQSLQRLIGCRLEPGLGQAAPGSRYQFERHGYFCADLKESVPGQPVWNRAVSLRDTWAKIEKAAE